MHGIFLAQGPQLRRGATIPPFENIHLYPLLASLLKLKPASGIDGKRNWLWQQIKQR